MQKNYFLIGASSGMADALVTSLLDKGDNVFLSGRSLPEKFSHLPFLLNDWTQEQADVSQFLPSKIDGLVYFPGSITLKPFQRLSDYDIMRDMHISTIGLVRAIRASLKQLKGGASVVGISTVAVQTGMGFHASVAMAKGALEGLIRSLAAEYAHQQIRFNAIAPSLTDTPLAASLLSSDDKRAASAARHPLGRIGTSTDMANSIRFLLSEESAWITGQILSVDGGMGKLK